MRKDYYNWIVTVLLPDRYRKSTQRIASLSLRTLCLSYKGGAATLNQGFA